MKRQYTTASFRVKNASVWTKISRAFVAGACGSFLLLNPAPVCAIPGFDESCVPTPQARCFTVTAASLDFSPPFSSPPARESFAPSFPSPETVQTGIASWYGPKFHGKRTANGEVYNQYELTAAHRTLPLGSRVFVTNLRTNLSVVVRINDRGPYIDGRIIDLSYAAAQRISVDKPGIAPVRIELLSRPDNR